MIDRNTKRHGKPIKSPDEFLTFSQRVLAYARSHKKQVYGVIAGLLVSVGIYTAGWAYWGYMNKKAQMVYGTAVSRFNAILYDNEKLKAEGEEVEKLFQDLYRKYPFSSPAKLIYPFVAYLKFQSGNLDEAVENLKAFSERSKKHDDAFLMSQMALAKCLEQKGDMDGALSLLSGIQLDRSNPTQAPILYERIRLLMRKSDGKAKEEALALFKELKENWPDYPMLPVLEQGLADER